ncbi:zinc-binding dehydrogenase [Streptosporangium amethystogenes]|uniref:zinc-binding dehydrogenase n=1 Tax=Streptosporangium amethystogenes TaxID=2002 RepID=UPI0037B62EA1
MTSHATALVQTGPGTTEFREIPLPALNPGEVLVRVAANGLCGSDIDAFEGAPGWSFEPRIGGHEIVGVIESLGPVTRAREGLKIGDLVAVNPLISCGECSTCRQPGYVMCTGFDHAASYGFIPLTVGAGLWGGYATHVVVHAKAILYPFPSDFDPLDATLWNPLGGAIQWSVMNVGTTIGSTVAILGSGQRGLASVVATKSAGAELVLATGLDKDRHKLELAREFGADAVVNVEADDLVVSARELTGGRGFDIVIDTTPGATRPIEDAIEIVRPGGTIGLVGIKGRTMDGFPIDKIGTKSLRIVGSMGTGHDAYRIAAQIIASNRFPLSKMRTHTFGFDQLAEAIRTLKGETEEKSINIVITPTFKASGSH